jgi:hypothetical protein
MAPGVLKSALTQHGIKSVAIDLNAEIRQYILTHPKKDDLLQFILTEQVTPGCQQDIHNLISMMVDRILAFNPEWVILSLLTYISQIPNKWLCFQLRQRNPNIKIIIGGPGCFSSLKSIDSYAVNLKSQGLVDHFVAGDGEVALPMLLKGETGPGINNVNWQQLDNIDILPSPDYDDYNWSLYRLKKVNILGSRGCVRECTFCDIHEHWPKFQWRSGANIFEEMKYQREKYGINYFSFADSLVNGNQREYRDLIQRLADYNQAKTDPDDKINWTGAFIVRPADQMKERDWELTAASGAVMLSVGVESFVEHIRYHIKKKFSNADLDYALQMAQKHNVSMQLLMIVGYVTETQEDHEQQKQWVTDNRHYINSPIKLIQIGSGLGILPGTWLQRNQESLGIKIGSADVYQDWVRESIGSTPLVRMQWHKEMKQHMEQTGFTVAYLKDNHVLIENYLRDRYAKT